MNPSLRIPRLVVGAALAIAVAGPSRAADPSPPLDYIREIRPILAKRCFACHGADPESRKQGLRLDTFEAATELRGTTRAIAPGKPEASAILERILDPHDDERMPPRESGARLSAEEIAKLTKWIELGAPYAEHWALLPPRKTPPQGSLFDSLAHDELDRYVFAEWMRHDLGPSNPADRRTWLRRVSLDLTGLPPSLDDVIRFENDSSEQAFERVVDRLLSSPAYGERMARLWLDLARYADSAGYGSDPLRTIYRYRDYVIDAFRTNRPLDEFVIEQIAGDLLPNPTEEQVLATAFHRNTLTNTEGGTDDEEFRIAAVKDRANVTMQAFMGLTFGCAQCHSHKFDPISHEEYYRLFAFFDQTEDADRADETPVLETVRREFKERAATLSTELERVRSELESRKAELAATGSAQLDEWRIGTLRRVHSFQPLIPSAAYADRGAKLSIRGDRITADQVAQRSTYSLTFPRPSSPLRAIALETRPRLGAANPNFVLNEIRVREVEPRPSLPKVRFVRIELSGDQRILSLAEVEVLSRGTNLARDKRVTQSSIAYDGPPGLAVDGDTSGEFDHGSVTHTATEANPWFEIDLTDLVEIERIVIWNRSDHDHGRRLDGARILLLDAERSVLASEALDRAALKNEFDLSRRSTPLRIVRASPDFEQQDFTAAATNDGDTAPRNGFAVAPHQDQPHRLVLEFERGIMAPFVVEIEQNYGEEHVLGDFSVAGSTESGSPFLALSAADNAVLESPGDDASRRRLVELAAPHISSLAAVSSEVTALETELADLPRVTTPIMRELPQDRRRTSFALSKGNFLDRIHRVEPGVPAKLHPWPVNQPLDRLGLARWLTTRDNPLFARVFVNRMWSMLFGRGLVFTEEDFGVQGTPPENQALLDALAVDFANSGFDIRELLKRMVLSYTYRQVSSADARTLRIDPDNKWLARGPRHRVDAEIVRDQALAVAGLLSDKLYGPPVYPPQPDGMWRAAFNGERSYVTSAGEDRYRRSIYTVWRRTVPYPSLATFDAPSRETCALRRTRTNTPLQAFVTLNDPAFVECAQSLARRILRESAPDDTARAKHGLELTQIARPDARAVSELVELARTQREHFRIARVDARTLATEPLGALSNDLDEVEAATWTVVANVLLNSDAFLTKN